jgi:CRP/FNR family transcriptional regulator, nitrogen fixation regulation protein
MFDDDPGPGRSWDPDAAAAGVDPRRIRSPMGHCFECTVLTGRSIHRHKIGVKMTFDLSATPSAGVDLLDTLGVILAFAPNRQIYAESEPATNLYRILSGAVRSYKIFDDGRRQIGDFYIAGDVLGLELGEEHVFSAEAITKVRAHKIKRSTITEIAQTEAPFAFRLWTLSACELGRARAHVLLLTKTAPERLASFLLEMAARSGTANSASLPMPRRDIADYLGLTVETVSRAFSELQQAGAIELATSQHVVFRDRNSLEVLMH